jgi:hypothetical protein
MVLIMVFLSGCQENTGDKGTQIGTDSRFLGSWKNNDASPDNETWTFYTNASVKSVITQELDEESLTSTSWFKIKVNGSSLCLSSPDVSPESPSYYSECFAYEFSENASSFSLSFDGTVFMVLSKIS